MPAADRLLRKEKRSITPNLATVLRVTGRTPDQSTAVTRTWPELCASAMPQTPEPGCEIENTHRACGGTEVEMRGQLLSHVIAHGENIVDELGEELAARSLLVDGGHREAVATT